MDRTGQVDGHTFGQRQPPLYVTIGKILDKYPDGQIFKVSAQVVLNQSCIWPCIYSTIM